MYQEDHGGASSSCLSLISGVSMTTSDSESLFTDDKIFSGFSSSESSFIHSVQNVNSNVLFGKLNCSISYRTEYQLAVQISKIKKEY